ncbi:MAG: hypothetical protein JSS97_11865 [Actinobacteria bacterium]|nr:hypothetical protein [Actinomycetota bacterium]
MRLTYHAKNGLRKVRGTRQEAESVVRNPIGKDLDPDGKPRYLGYIAGELCRIVVALDEPDVIVTIHERRHL